MNKRWALLALLMMIGALTLGHFYPEFVSPVDLFSKECK